MLAILLALALLLPCTAAAFEDVSGRPSEAAVTRLTNLGILHGYEDGTFRPDSPVTRAEMAKILVTALAVQGPEGEDSFSDTADHWAAPYIGAAAALGLIRGYPDGSFRPDDSVTTAEVLTMLVRALGMTYEKGTWPEFHIDTAKQLGIITGDVSPAAAAGRGNVAVYLANTLDLSIGTTTDAAWYANNDGTDTMAYRLTGVTQQTAQALAAYEAAIDIKYALSVMEKLMSLGTNPNLGFRTAGSSAELAAADYLSEELTKLGFEVTKEPVKLDTWTFKHASLAYTDASGSQKTLTLAAYHVQYVADNAAMELVYAGRGTEADYDGLDVTGKLVLIDIDQMDDWWINWPAYQAKVKGAAAVIAVNTAGYATYDEATIGVQDFCGPANAPAFSVSQKDANALKAALTAAGGTLSVRFSADSRVTENGTAYNIVAEIPGKSSDEVVGIIGHYDAYFRAFSDNTSGVGCMMGIAKALSDSGYTPEKTLRLVFHCAE